MAGVLAGNEVLTGAILDRLLHASTVLSITEVEAADCGIWRTRCERRGQPGQPGAAIRSRDRRWVA